MTTGEYNDLSAEVSSEPFDEITTFVEDDTNIEFLSLNNAQEDLLTEGIQVQPNDELHVVVLGEENLSGFYKISPSGYIYFPLIGKVMVKDKTVAQIQKILVMKLQDGYIKNPFIKIDHQIIDENKAHGGQK